MEALRTEPVSEGEMPASSVQVVSKVLSQNSSNLFLKNVGFQTPPSSKSVSSNESQLREQLAAEATAAVQGELNDLKKKIQNAEEDTMEAFQTWHTSSKRGLSDPAREALVSAQIICLLVAISHNSCVDFMHT
jgi:hypothetical protein